MDTKKIEIGDNQYLIYNGVLNEDGEPMGFGNGEYYKSDVKFADYVGTWLKGKWHEHGKLTTNEYIYLGGFKNGKKNGNGKLKYKYISINIDDNKNKVKEYDGNWKNDKRHGHGIQTWHCGRKYIGNWTNDKMSKDGKMIYIDENNIKKEYTGKFKYDMPFGYGKIVWENGDVYDGYVKDKNCMPHGNGKKIYKNGDVYNGNWLNGMMSGHGIMEYKDINNEIKIYDGIWENNLKHGKCYILYRNNDIFIGNYLNDKKHGECIIKTNNKYRVYTYKNGRPMDYHSISFINKGKVKLDHKQYQFKYTGDIIKTYRNRNIFKCTYKNHKLNGNAILDYTNNKDELNIKCIHYKYKNNKLNGKCKYVYKNEDVKYIEYINDKKHGLGFINYENGDTYVGNFIHDKITGNGEMFYKALNYIYTGEFKDGKKYGYGKLYDNKNKRLIYDGNFKLNNYHGVGKLYMYDPCIIYEGNFINNIKNGHGKLTEKHINNDGKTFDIIYDGLWENDMKCGMGTLNLGNGSNYTGNFLNNLFDGSGVFIYPSGSEYHGEWKKNQKNGHGVYKYNNGDIYKGFFKNDIIHGKGKYSWINGKTYNGDWDYGQRKGNGEFIDLNGNEYVGKFNDNKYNGHGIMVYKTLNHTYKGEWKDNKRNGHGKLDTNEFIYDGNWNNDLKNGKFNVTNKINKQTNIQVFYNDVLNKKETDSINLISKVFTDICPICQEDIGDQPCKAACGHCFHTSCLFKWIQKRNNCPMCRKKVII